MHHSADGIAAGQTIGKSTNPAVHATCFPTIVWCCSVAALSATTGRGFTARGNRLRFCRTHGKTPWKSAFSPMLPTAGSMNSRRWGPPWSPAASTMQTSCAGTNRRRNRWPKNCVGQTSPPGRRANRSKRSSTSCTAACLYAGYDLAATDLRVVLDEGRFNCVSATVLFNYFGGDLGLKCRGLEMPSHAMSRVLLPDGAIDVETTCPGWFHLADAPRQQEAAASSTIGAAAWADRSKAREVSPIQLAAIIYYNRGVDLLAEKRFAEAAAANAKSLRLDPNNRTARGNLLATINNWSIHLGDSGALCRGGRFAAARAGNRSDVRPLRPELRPRSPPMGRTSLPRGSLRGSPDHLIPGNGRNAWPRLSPSG